jgi:zinc/manganese transport system substrate-binding protein
VKLFASLLSLFFGLAGVARAELKVVTTVPALAAIARDVGGARVKVTSLALPTQDPHFVDAKPSLALELSRADLLVAVGLQLEVGWLPTLQIGARNPAIQIGSPGYLDASQFVKLLEVPMQALDRSMGDVHPGGNPHYLYDPRAAAAVARGLAGRLKQLDPQGAAEYDRTLAGFLERLETARIAWEKRLAPARGQAIVTYHRSWVYLAAWLGLEEVATIEPKPGIPPTPGHAAKVLAAMRAHKVRVILREGYYPDAMCDVLAQRAGAKAILLPGGPDLRAGQGYVQYVEELVGKLEKGLLP